MKPIYTKKHNNHNDLFALSYDQTADSKLAAGYRLRWTEEGLLGEREAETAGEKMGRNISLPKVNWLLVIIAASFLLLLGRAAWLQLYRGPYYQELAQYNRIRQQRIMADRGVIYDSERHILVDNIPVFYLQVIPADLMAREPKGMNNLAIIKAIGDILGEGAATDLDYLLMQYRQNTLAAYQPQTVADKIGYPQAMKLMLATKDMPGVTVGLSSQRQYRLPSLSSSHILGYTGIITPEEYERYQPAYALTDYVGKTGLEKIWEKQLRGRYGEKYIEVDALGKEKRVINELKKEDGYNLLLAINSALQSKLEQELSAQLTAVGASKAAAVALNPANGEIMALVSLPSFNSNDFAAKISPEIYQQLISNPNQPLFNRAVSGEFPTGSTFKPVVAAAALQENVVTSNTLINSAGGLQIKDWFFPDWKAGGHGLTDIRKALAWSVNTYFYYLGGGYNDFTGLGVRRITDYAHLFGLGQPLGIDLPGEAAGFLPSKEWKESVKKEIWYIGDTYHLAIGQGDITATPLQVAAYTAVFANGGILYQPHLVKELLNSQDETAQIIEPKILRHDFIEEENVKLVRQGMRDCVTYGSCLSLDSLPVTSAGKTGSAQWSSDLSEKTHSWFTGFAPFENPEIVITVIVEEGGEATEAAVPVAKRVLEWYFGTRSH